MANVTDVLRLLQGRTLSERGAGDAGEARRIVEECYSAWRARLYIYSLSLCRNAAEAEDVTQEVFLRLYKALADGSVKDVRYRWLLTVAHNMVVDNGRKRRPEVLCPEGLERSLSETVPDGASSAEQAMLDAANGKAWRRAVSSLSSLQRACIVLRSEGRTFREISELLNVKMSYAVDQTNRAIEKLRRRVKE